MLRIFASCFIVMTISACSSYPPIKTAEYVDLQRFMGDWYVISNIPTFIEEGAHNAIESYQLDKDGTVATTFSFYQDDFNGEKKTYTPRGFVLDKKSNAVWGMRFIWPFKADYRIVYVDDNYQQTIIGRVKRDYVWIMSRTPIITNADYEKLLTIIKEQGYDISKLQKVPQKWPSQPGEQ